MQKNNSIPSHEKQLSFFDSTYEKIYSNLLNKDLDRQSSFIKTHILNQFQEPKILDFCCGHGRHLLRFWKEGFDIEGLDIKENAIEHIRKITNNKVPIFHQDGRYFQSEYNYDVVINMETSIVYLKDEENLEMLKSIHNCMENEGIFLLHLVNREYLIKYFNPLVWFQNEQQEFAFERRSLDLESGSLVIKQNRLVDSDLKEYNIKMRLYSLSEIRNELQKVGFYIDQVFGDFDGSRYGVESPNMIILCKME